MKDLRTAQLWLTYMEMVDIMRRFIKSERAGNWNLYLQLLRDMLPYLAAAGHSLYTKSIHVYLQRLELSTQHPEVQQHFKNGLHVVRRSDRYWAGLSDLVIEQVLMRSMKTTGGLPRGRGMEESQPVTWLLSSPVCTDVNSALQDYTSIQYVTSEQHNDLTTARKERDTNDTYKLIHFLTSKSQFTRDDSSLHSIDTGVTAGDRVNADTVINVGQQILTGMIDHKVTEYVFKKKDQVLTLDTNSSIHTRTESVFIDPQLLFQRLVTACMRCGDLQDVFAYELCSCPPALFETANVFLTANNQYSPLNLGHIRAKLKTNCNI